MQDKLVELAKAIQTEGKRINSSITIYTFPWDDTPTIHIATRIDSNYDEDKPTKIINLQTIESHSNGVHLISDGFYHENTEVKND